ncbi:MAG: hypothetical protein QM771_17735 [Nitrospira sp.]
MTGLQEGTCRDLSLAGDLLDHIVERTLRIVTQQLLRIGWRAGPVAEPIQRRTVYDMHQVQLRPMFRRQHGRAIGGMPGML